MASCKGMNIVCCHYTYTSTSTSYIFIYMSYIYIYIHILYTYTPIHHHHHHHHHHFLSPRSTAANSSTQSQKSRQRDIGLVIVESPMFGQSFRASSMIIKQSEPLWKFVFFSMASSYHFPSDHFQVGGLGLLQTDFVSWKRSCNTTISSGYPLYPI